VHAVLGHAQHETFLEQNMLAESNEIREYILAAERVRGNIHCSVRHRITDSTAGDQPKPQRRSETLHHRVAKRTFVPIVKVTVEGEGCKRVYVDNHL
jgi:hypothetical protein